MTKPISEKEFEKFDDEFQFALYLLCQCKDFLIQKSTKDIDFELKVKMINDSLDTLGFVLYHLRKDEVEWDFDSRKS